MNMQMTGALERARSQPMRHFQLNRDIDKDGTVDIALMATFSGGVAGAAGYEVQYEDSAGQSTTARADSGKYWFPANTTRSYRTRWRTINWVGEPGAWSSYTGYVTPSPTTGAPAAPSVLSFSAGVQAMFYSWNPPSELDYAYTELAIKLGSPGTPSASEIVGSTVASSGSIFFFPRGASNNYFYGRHCNTSGLKSSWVLLGSGDSLAATIGGKTNIGTANSGSVNPGSGVGALVTVSFRCTNSGAGTTITLNGTSRTIDFTDERIVDWTEWFSGSGPYTFSKSGPGTYNDCALSAVVFR